MSFARDANGTSFERRAVDASTTTSTTTVVCMRIPDGRMCARVGEVVGVRMRRAMAAGMVMGTRSSRRVRGSSERSRRRRSGIDVWARAWARSGVQ